MKMIAGAASRACLNRSRTRAAPTPTIISMNSDAARLKKGTPAWPAIARASSVGPNPTSSLNQDDAFSSTALVTTPLSSSRFSRSWSAKAGRWVLNSFDSRAFGAPAAGAPAPGGGYAVFFLKFPWIASPTLVTSATLPASTCCLKKV